MPGQTGLKRILIATGNAGKLKEFRHMLGSEYEVLGLADIDFEGDIVEDAETFSENALIKARVLHAHTGLAVLADDSGLEVDLLNGYPGIFSARWGGKKGDFKKAMNRVYKELDKKDKDWRDKKIKARFVCALTVYQLDKTIINSVGKIEGHISPFIKGENGFGYDPIFIPQGKKITFSEMKPSQKFKIDHRYKAFKKIKKFF